MPNRKGPLGETAWNFAMPESSAGFLRVGVVATPVGDAADRALDALLAAVARRLPHEAKRAWNSAEGPAPSFAELQACDVAVIYGRRMPLTGEALARVQWYCQRGRPLVALRAGGGPTFAHWPQFDSDVLGIGAAGSVAAESGPWRVNPCAPSHPIVADIGAMGFCGSLPRGIQLSDHAEVLLECRGAGPPQPAAWTHPRGPARVFATVLGQPDHLAAPAFAVLVGNALHWVSRRATRE